MMPKDGSTESETQGLKMDIAREEASPFVATVVSALLGVCFGLVMQRSYVFAPISIRGQMTMDRFLMLKMFLSATTTCVAGFLCLHTVAPQTFEASKADSSSKGGLLSTAIGAGLLGMGMSIAGACPGMVFQQVGANVPWGWFTMLGGLLGALVYSSVHSKMSELKAMQQPSADTVHELLGVSYPTVAIPLLVTCGGMVALFEVLFPWQDASEGFIASPSGTTVFGLARWPPIVAGIIIGLLQIPFGLALGRTLGSSSAYVTVTSQWLAVASTETKEEWAYLEAARCGMAENFWQLVYLLGSCLGGFIGAYTSVPSQFGPNKVAGVTPAAAVLGGFCMVFGSRLAEGCTSGHGLSGVPMMHVRSFVAVMAMFGGGIVTGFVMKAADLNIYTIGYGGTTVTQ